MNLQPSEADLRLQMQQIEMQSLRDRPPTNPFVAAFGLGVITLVIWLLYAGAQTIAHLASIAQGWR